MTTARISLGYKPRAQFIAYHKRRQRWACIVAHRRAGKSVACIMDLINATLKSKKTDARFGYVAPTYTQAKDVVWSYLKEYTHRIPGVELRESDLSVIFPTGARIRLYGSDNHDRLRGIYLDGVVMDEYADMAPQAWAQVIRPALADRKGWATFIGTPKGRNSFFEIYDYARHNPDEWFSLELRADETGILDDDELDSARRVLTAEQFAQEFLCSFDAAILGSYFGRELDEAQQASRIASVPYDPLLPVHTAWDLGIGDSTAIWFFQVSRAEVRVIDHYEAAGHGLPHYAAVLASRGYTYGTDYLPHDAQARQLGTGRSLWETLHSLTNRIPRILPQQNVMDGINAARVTIGSAWFDADKCHDGLEALRAYRADYDDKRKAFTDRPRHDWASHCFHGETNILTRHGMCRIMDLPQTGEVLTPCGWRAYRNPRVTMRDAQLAEVVFSDGHTVRCTPDHLFLTVGGWKSACDLATGSQIQSSLTLSRSISMAASIAYGRARNIYREAAQSCTAMFGGCVGPVSKRCHIHHRDNDPFNNALSNLECQDGTEHLSRTWAEQHAISPKQFSDEARAKAAEWHKSDAGRLWHSRNAKRSKGWTKWRREDYPCELCGKVTPMLVRESGHAQRFCSSNCKATYYRWRRIAARVRLMSGTSRCRVSSVSRWQMAPWSITALTASDIWHWPGARCSRRSQSRRLSIRGRELFTEPANQKWQAGA